MLNWTLLIRVFRRDACRQSGTRGAGEAIEPAAVGGFLAMAVVLALAVGGCGWAEDTAGAVGNPAPEYAAPSVAGDTVSLADLKGEVVLLNIWATWCPPCRVEMPHLQSLHEELGDQGLRVVGVSVDSRGASGAVDRFTGDLGIEFLILRDPSERIAHLFGAYGVPFNVLIDREGIVRWRHSGPVTADDPALRSALEAAL